MMRVMVTGATGFMGRNLMLRLSESKWGQAVPFVRDVSSIRDILSSVDAIVHLAGVNRPSDPVEFMIGNVDLTQRICDVLSDLGRSVPIVFASSIQAERDNLYGRTKRNAEEILRQYGASQGSPIYVFRLPNVFGKWCRPNYNSVVATFCHNIPRDLPIRIDDPSAKLKLVHIDDVIDKFLGILSSKGEPEPQMRVEPEYEATVGELASLIRSFHEGRETLTIGRVGAGLPRALYSTYVSYLPVEKFSYPIKRFADERGSFVEMLKTVDSGQFSFFSAFPGVTRGGHYHHTKTEKFLVIRGEARFQFRNLLTSECHELRTSGSNPEIVETVPGWVHDITNVGTDEMLVMLWANEVFDRMRPDTFSSVIR